MYRISLAVHSDAYQRMDAMGGDIYRRMDDLREDVNIVGAHAAALSGLHPIDYNPYEPTTLSAASVRTATSTRWRSEFSTTRART